MLPSTGQAKCVFKTTWTSSKECVHQNTEHQSFPFLNHKSDAPGYTPPTVRRPLLPGRPPSQHHAQPPAGPFSSSAGQSRRHGSGPFQTGRHASPTLCWYSDLADDGAALLPSPAS